MNYLFTICWWGIGLVGKRETAENTTSDTKCGIAHPCFQEFSILNIEFSRTHLTCSQHCSTISRFFVYNFQVGKREAAEYPTSDTKCRIAHPCHVHKIASRFHEFTNFLFAICSWGKERPLKTRLLIQNVVLPIHIFTNSQFGILNFSKCFTISRIFCLSFAGGEKRGL